MTLSKNVAIIGGGPGGLLSAYLLEQKLGRRCNVTLFEASERTGGKIASRTFGVAPVPYEAGVAELYDYSVIGPDPLRQLVKQLGLRTTPMTGPGVVLDGQLLNSDADIKRHCGSKTLDAIRKFHRRCHEAIAPEDYYEGHWQDDNGHDLAKESFQALLNRIDDPLARRYVQAAVHSDTACEPHQTNALNGIKNVLMDDPRYMRLYTIDGGIERLPEAIRQCISTRVLLGHAVTHVEKLPSQGYRVRARHKGLSVTNDFDLVLLALPNYWLQMVEFADDRLARAMHKHCKHYDRPAHYLRVSVLFRERFWKDRIRGSYFMSDAFDGCCVYEESARQNAQGHGVLGWLLAGHSAMVLSNLPKRQLLSRVLDSLPPELAQGKDLVLEHRVHRWNAAINALPGGYPTSDPVARHRPDAEGNPDLYVVGDYMFDSTVNGVLDSADVVSDMVLSRILREEHQAPAVHAANGHALKADYFASYDGENDYDECFEEYFDAEYSSDLIATIWGIRPPYKLLDVGSANGRTLEEFGKLGIDAWGVENSPAMHARTPARLLAKNRLGDVRNLPFPDNSFDFVYETCLCYVPPEDLEQAIRELHRVTRYGFYFGSMTTDMTPECIEKHDIFYGVQTMKTMWEWSEVFLRNGFRMAVTDERRLDRSWKIETAANEGDVQWYANRDGFRLCFYTKVGGVSPARSRRVRRLVNRSQSP